MFNDIWKAWYYAGPYVPSGVMYGKGPSACHWLIPGYEYWYDAQPVDLYDGPSYAKKVR